MHCRLKLSSFFLSIGLISVGIAATAYVAGNPIPRNGLHMMWILPILGGISVATLICYNRKYNAGIGIYLFSVIVLAKYILMPMLMALSGGFIKWYRDSGTHSQNEFSVFIMVLELVVSTIAIIHYIKKYDCIIPIDRGLDQSKITPVTWMVIAAICAICVVRYNRLIGNVHFFILSDTESVGSFEQIALQVLKSYAFVRVVIYCKEKYAEKALFRYILVSLFAAILNCGIFFGINRSLILQTAIATIIVLVYAFPSYRKVFAGTIIPVIIIIMLSITLLRHFNLQLDDASADIFSIDELSTTIETYTCGPLVITSTIDAAEKYRHLLGIEGIISDFVCNFFPFYFPGLSSIRDYFSAFENTSQLYNHTIGDTGGMIPMIGQLSFYFGNYLAVVVDIGVFIWVAKVLVASSYKAKRVKSIEDKFYYVWLATLFSFAMCYCLITFLWSWSKFALFYLLLNWVNRYLVLRN